MTRKAKLTAEVKKRGRGRPSNADRNYAALETKYCEALDFIREQCSAESEEWLASRGLKTAGELLTEKKVAEAEKRERLEREIAERQAELAAL